MAYEEEGGPVLEVAPLMAVEGALGSYGGKAKRPRVFV